MGECNSSPSRVAPELIIVIIGAVDRTEGVTETRLGPVDWKTPALQSQ